MLRLGFIRKSTEGTQMLYQHSEKDTWILLPPYELEDEVRPVHLVAARRLLDERGLIEAEEFDRLIADASPQSDADCIPDISETTLAVAP